MMTLQQVLMELLPKITGSYWLGDGGLLGLTRNGKLIENDNDIDLYILQDTIIDLNDSPLCSQRYHICDKIYFPDNKPIKLNPWKEYCSITKVFNPSLNRSKVMELASKTYKDNKIIPKFTENHIDIFTLKQNPNDQRYYTNWKKNYYYNEDDLKPVINTDLGFPVNIFNNAEEVLERQYGTSWKIPNPDFKYF